MPIVVDGIGIGIVNVNGSPVNSVKVGGIEVFASDAYAYTIANPTGARYGYISGLGGALAPSTFNSLVINKVECRSDSNQVSLTLGANEQAAGVNTIRVTTGGVSADLPFSSGAYFVTDAAFTAEVVSKVGTTVTLLIEAV